MAELEYSAGALDTLRLFHQSRFVVFVEGPGDIAFWQAIFRTAGVSDTFFKIAGGRGTLDRYMSAAIAGAEIVIARDTDWSDLTNAQVVHARVMYTFGYSIENTLCSEAATAGLLRMYLSPNDDHSVDAAEWRDYFGTAIRAVVVLDLARTLADGGADVPLDNAFRYLDRRQRDRVNPDAVTSIVAALTGAIDEECIREAERRLAQSPKHVWYHIRGHCVVSALLQLVSYRAWAHTGKKLLLSNDAIYGLLVIGLAGWLANTAEWSFYRGQIDRLLGVLPNTASDVMSVG